MSVAKWNLKGAVAQNSDPTNRNWIHGWLHGVTRQWTGTPNRHPGTRTADPAGPEGRTHHLSCEVARVVRTIRTTGVATRGMACEKLAEAIVGRGVGEAIEAPQCRKARERIGPTGNDGRRAESFYASLGESSRCSLTRGLPLRPRFLWRRCIQRRVGPRRPSKGRR